MMIMIMIEVIATSLSTYLLLVESGLFDIFLTTAFVELIELVDPVVELAEALAALEIRPEVSALSSCDQSTIGAITPYRLDFQTITN